MENLNAFLTVVGGILGIIGLIALAVAIFRASVTKQTIELLRNDRDDANARADGISKDFDRFKEKANLEKKQLADQVLGYEVRDSEKSQEIMILRNVVTGKDQLDRIEKLLTRLTESRINDQATAETRASGGFSGVAQP